MFNDNLIEKEITERISKYAIFLSLKLRSIFELKKAKLQLIVSF